MKPKGSHHLQEVCHLFAAGVLDLDFETLGPVRLSMIVHIHDDGPLGKGYRQSVSLNTPI